MTNERRFDPRSRSELLRERCDEVIAAVEQRLRKELPPVPGCDEPPVGNWLLAEAIRIEAASAAELMADLERGLDDAQYVEAMVAALTVSAARLTGEQWLASLVSTEDLRRVAQRKGARSDDDAAAHTIRRLTRKLSRMSPAEIAELGVVDGEWRTFTDPRLKRFVATVVGYAAFDDPPLPQDKASKLVGRPPAGVEEKALDRLDLAGLAGLAGTLDGTARHDVDQFVDLPTVRATWKKLTGVDAPSDARLRQAVRLAVAAAPFGNGPGEIVERWSERLALSAPPAMAAAAVLMFAGGRSCPVLGGRIGSRAEDVRRLLGIDARYRDDVQEWVGGMGLLDAWADATGRLGGVSRAQAHRLLATKVVRGNVAILRSECGWATEPLSQTWSGAPDSIVRSVPAIGRTFHTLVYARGPAQSRTVRCPCLGWP